MKKTILCILLFVLVSTCFVTNAMAAPKITGIQGGYGVTATVEDGANRNWMISLEGSQIYLGRITTGNITSDHATIRTPIFPPALGIGKINVRVTIFWIIIPVAMEQRSAFMLGPFVMFVQ